MSANLKMCHLWGNVNDFWEFVIGGAKLFCVKVCRQPTVLTIAFFDFALPLQKCQSFNVFDEFRYGQTMVVVEKDELVLV